MKLKGINTFERHVEKIVLVAVSVIFLAVLAMQFLLQPNLVKVGNGPAVPPQLAFEQVERKARELDAKMRQSPDLPDYALPDPAEQFAAALERPVAPRPRLAALGRPVPIQAAGAVGEIPEGTRIAPLNVPAPTGAVAAAYWLTLDPAEVVANAELRSMLADEQPFDVPLTSVQATFNGVALREALSTDPDGEEGPMTALPPNWWRGAVEVLAVRLEREELSPTGDWTNLTEVPALPGRPNLLAKVGEGVNGLAGAAQLLGQARGYGDQVFRPSVYRTIAGAPWVPPAEAAAAGGPSATTPEIDLKLRQRESLVAQADRQREAIAKAGGATGTRGAEREGGSGGGKGGMVRSGGQDREPQQQDSRTAALEARLKRLEDQIARIDEELAQLGYVAPSQPGSAPVQPVTPTQTQTATAFLDTADLTVWAHDLTAEPGKTYRYRVQVAVNNPAFGRDASLSEDQRGLAAEPVLLSAASEWTSPVQVLDDSYFFITGASEADQFGSSAATAELYRFYYGYYRKGETRLEPGDPVLASVKLPDPAMLPIYDLENLGAAVAPEQPAARPVDEGLGGGKGGTRAVAPSEEGRGGRAEQPSTQPNTPPAGAKPGPSSLTASADAFLLDVTRSPVAVEASLSGSSRQPVQVLLRGRDGSIAVRSPEEARSALYQRVAQSAQQGETQGQPAAPREPEPAAPTRQPTRDRQEPAGSGGGGMGGG